MKIVPNFIGAWVDENTVLKNLFFLALCPMVFLFLLFSLAALFIDNDCVTQCPQNICCKCVTEEK